MRSLALRGRAETSGFEASIHRTILRLAEASSKPVHDADSAIVRSQEDAAEAASNGFTSVALVGYSGEGSNAFSTTTRFSSDLDWLGSGDVVAIEPRAGMYRVLWRQASGHNAFLVTDRCDHYCLMCSQPPKDVDDGWIIDEIGHCLDLINPKSATLGFTGGEPFLDWQRFIPLVHKAQLRLPDTSIHVLSNGRAFARPEVVEAWSKLDKPRVCLGIPIYSAVPSTHDYVVQSSGAFDETVLGIMRLKDRGNRVEVRIVLHSHTLPRLAETCEWLARNLPFIDHVALMGMEDTGFALANHGELWIDPMDFGEVLMKGVEILNAAGLRTSIYNLPLCVLPPAVHRYSAQSISDWKNAHPPVCAPCTARNSCAGFFTTGKTKFSRGIAPLGV